jgi:hypothetical protein
MIERMVIFTGKLILLDHAKSAVIPNIVIT